ncbi:MAG: DUF366 family protein [Pseudobdellovibrio sp.]
MKSLFVDDKKDKKKKLKKYDGSQLRPLFAYENFSLEGESIISWISPCDVNLDHMVDYEDKIADSKICGDEMLHFIIEFFPAHLQTGVSLQRLLAAIVKDEILKMLKNKDLAIERSGDDLYVTSSKIKKGKLSISIASVSVVSTMIHFALNVKNTGTPVKTFCLEDVGINAKKLSLLVMKTFSEEYQSIVFATKKVKPL